MKINRTYNSNHQRMIAKAGMFCLVLLLMLLISGCVDPVSEAAIPTQVEIAATTQPPVPTSTPTMKPTVLPPTNTPTATDIPTPAATPTDRIKKEPISVQRDENLIRGTMVGDGDFAVVLAPMYGESRGRWLKFAEYIAPLGYTVVAFDFPGPFGSSSGEFKFDQVQFDALAVIEHLREMGYERIVCMGASIGAGACFEAARIDPSLAGIVLISAPLETTAEETAALVMPKLLISGDEPDVKDTLREDYVVIPDPKQFVFINQKAHGTEMLNTDDQLRDVLVEFLQDLV